MRHTVVIAACALVVVAAAVLGCMAGFAVLAATPTVVVPELVWESGSGRETPDDFLVLMYPADDDVGVFAGPADGSERVGTLDRAMANRTRELGDGWIYANGVAPGTGGYVRRDRLVFDVPAGRRETLLAALEASEVARGLEPRVTRVESLGDGFRARIGWDDGSWDEYEWRVAGGAVTPISVARWHEQTVAMEGVGVLMVAAVIGGSVFSLGVLTGTVAVLVLAYRRRAA